MPSFPIHLSNSTETFPRAPITTRTISTFLSFHKLLIFFFKCWYFSTFSFSFSSTFTSAGTIISVIILFCSFLSITIYWVRSSLLYRVATLNIYVAQCLDLFILFCSFQSMLVHFSLCSNLFFLQIPNELSLQHCRVVFCILFEAIFHIRLFHIHLFSNITYTGDFHCSY